MLDILFDAAARLRGDDREQSLLLWRRRGHRMFATDRAALIEAVSDDKAGA